MKPSRQRPLHYLTTREAKIFALACDVALARRGIRTERTIAFGKKVK